MKIKEIETLLSTLNEQELEGALLTFESDDRAGVKKIVDKYNKRLNAQREEKLLWHLKCEFDNIFRLENTLLVGIDEVGRGPLAGPVVAAAVILPSEVDLTGLKDSKKLSESKREVLYDRIKETALAIGVGIVDADRIDEINILQATFEAMRIALSQINLEYEKILVDGDKIIPQVNTPQEAIIGGDDKSASIAAASVIAKVTRDRMMKVYANTYDVYDWESNKGYGSKQHYDAIRAFGVTPLHRRSFLKNEGIV